VTPPHFITEKRMKRWIKRIGYVLGCLVALIVLAAAGVYGFSEARYRKQYDITIKPMVPSTDSARIARGSHLAHSVTGCAQCHGQNLEGAAIVDDPAFGRIYAPNLTSGKGGVGASLKPEDIARAVRHGVAPTGRALKIMPSEDYVSLSDDDLAAIVAFVKAAPPVDHETPAIMVGPIARTLMVAGNFPSSTPKGSITRGHRLRR
jgi:mono/diheme cytochrome c family protein